MPDPSDKPKIIVDSDWKQEAQREKEELDRESREAAEAAVAPEPSLLELVQMIVMQASIALGGFQDPHSGQRIPPNLPMAKHYIDLLDLFKSKTAANLSKEESAIIDATLHEMRMAFVQQATGGGGAPVPPAGETGQA